MVEEVDEFFFAGRGSLMVTPLESMPGTRVGSGRVGSGGEG